MLPSNPAEGCWVGGQLWHEVHSARLVVLHCRDPPPMVLFPRQQKKAVPSSPSSLGGALPLVLSRNSIAAAFQAAQAAIRPGRRGAGSLLHQVAGRKAGLSHPPPPPPLGDGGCGPWLR